MTPLNKLVGGDLHDFTGEYIRPSIGAGGGSGRQIGGPRDELRTRAPTLVALAALSLSLAGPATASPTASGVPAWACSSEEIARRRRVGRRGTRRAAAGQALVRDRDTGEAVRDLPKEAKGRAPSNFSVTVPVYWHVVTDGPRAPSPIRRSAPRSARSTVASAAARVGRPPASLLALRRHPHQQRRLVPGPVGGRRARVKRALKQGGDNSLNIYSTSGGALLGYAYLPEITDTAQAYLDGIVIDWRTMPGVSTNYAGVSNEGDTLTHAAGHWLDLDTASSGSATRTATSSATLRPRSPRRPAALRAKTLPGSRSRPDSRLHGLLTTIASPNSPRVRSSGCATPGCSGARTEALKRRERGLEKKKKKKKRLGSFTEPARKPRRPLRR